MYIKQGENLTKINVNKQKKIFFHKNNIYLNYKKLNLKSICSNKNIKN